MVSTAPIAFELSGQLVIYGFYKPALSYSALLRALKYSGPAFRRALERFWGGDRAEEFLGGRPIKRAKGRNLLQVGQIE
jgi:hypothetical protein